MKNSIESFLASLQAQNCSENTIRAYRADLNALAVFAGCHPSELDRQKVRAYLTHLHEHGASTTTKLRKRASLKSFLKFLVDEGVITQNVLATMRPPRAALELPEVPSEDEVNTLLERSLTSSFPERDKVIIELLYGTGIRVQELSGINLDDFRDKDVLLVRGKGKKERFVVFGEYAQAALDAYLPMRAKLLRKHKRTTTALLFGLSGKQVERLTERNIGRIVKQVARSKGLPERHPHAYRHAFASHMLDHGASIVSISRLLGHAKLSTTQLYTRVSTAHLLNAYQKAHPHANLLAL